MGAYIPGMEEHNAVNNDDGFSTGFIGKSSPFSSAPSQGFTPGPQPMNPHMTQPIPQQPMNRQMTQPIPVQPMNKQMTQPIPVQPMNKQMTQPIPVQKMNNKQPMPQKPVPQKINKPPKGKPIAGGNTNNMLKDTGAQVNNGQEKTSNVIGIISMVILVGMIIFVVLIISGKIGNKKPETKSDSSSGVVDTKTPEEEENEKMITKLTASCANLDEEGNFGIIPESPNDTCEDLICYIYDNVICTNGLCMVANDKDVYSKQCSTGEIRKGNKISFQATLNLSEICEILLNNETYNGTWETSYATCTNYECTTIVEGKEFNKTCTKDS